MININYKIEKSNGKLVLINQATGGRPYEVVGVHPVTKQLELSPSFPGTGGLDSSRIDDLDTELLKEHFPESYM